ncbi:MAG: aldehyde dehydrogenase family protein [Balneolaceae bacterium]
MEISELIQKQRIFFQSGRTREISWRNEQLQTLKTILSDHQDDFVDALHEDLHKPPFETLSAEILMVRQEIDLHLKNLDSWCKPKSVRGNLFTFPSDNEIRRAPFGVSLIIGSWNYPVNLILQPLAGSISGGNCTILKPSELAPATSSLLAGLLSRYYPTEYIAVAEGGADTAKRLLSERFDKIFFTGSFRIGQKVMEQAAKHCTPVTLELGGKCPAIVHRDADPEVAARRILWGKCLNAGQTCIAPDYLLIHESLADSFVRYANDVIRDFFGERPVDSPDFARIVNHEHFNRICSLMDGTKILAGGETDPRQNYIAPTLMSPPDWDHPVMKEEIFGPLLPILTYQQIEEVLPKVQQMPSPLTLYLFSNDSEWLSGLQDQLRYGSCCINDVMLNFSNLHLPFGGTGESGFGVYHGKESFEAFTRPCGIMTRKKWPAITLRYPPYRKKLTLLKRLLLR